MKLNTQIVSYIEVGYIPHLVELLGDNCFYRETYSEFDNYIYIPKSSIIDASDEFKKTEIYQALKDVFDTYPEHTDLKVIA